MTSDLNNSPEPGEPVACDWSHVVKQILYGEFADADLETRVRLIRALKHFNDPPAIAARQRLAMLQ